MKGLMKITAVGVVLILQIQLALAATVVTPADDSAANGRRPSNGNRCNDDDDDDETPQPTIKGSGTARNFNAENPYGTLQLVSKYEFNARSTSAGVEATYEPFGVTAIVYEARGEISIKNVLADDRSTVASRLKGRIIAIANLGPSEPIDGDDLNDSETVDPEADVWEIRFEIIRAEINGVPQQSPGFPVYGSIYVQDGADGDFLDESFAQEDLPDPSTLLNEFFGLEPVLRGRIEVDEDGNNGRGHKHRKHHHRHHSRGRFTDWWRRR